MLLVTSPLVLEIHLRLEHQKLASQVLALKSNRFCHPDDLAQISVAAGTGVSWPSRP